MADKYDIIEPPTERPRYFDDQWLDDTDFILEQNYHIAHQRRHERLLHVKGVLEGLGLSLDGSKLTVTTGSAIDGNGKHLFVVEQDQAASVPNGNGPWLAVLEYKESAAFPQDGADGHENRWKQSSVVTLMANFSGFGVILGQVLRSNGVLSLNMVQREYSGVRLPGAGSDVTLRRTGDGYDATLSGSLRITGPVMAGSLSGLAASPLVVTSGLTVGAGSPQGDRPLVVYGNATVTGTATMAAVTSTGLTVNGAATVKGDADFSGMVTVMAPSQTQVDARGTKRQLDVNDEIRSLGVRLVDRSDRVSGPKEWVVYADKDALRLWCGGDKMQLTSSGALSGVGSVGVTGAVSAGSFNFSQGKALDDYRSPFGFGINGQQNTDKVRDKGSKLLINPDHNWPTVGVGSDLEIIGKESNVPPGKERSSGCIIMRSQSAWNFGPNNAYFCFEYELSLFVGPGGELCLRRWSRKRTSWDKSIIENGEWIQDTSRALKLCSSLEFQFS